MDIYFIAAELVFPPGVIEAWSVTVSGGDEPRSVVEALAEAEGAVKYAVEGDRFSLRAHLIDAAYFGVSDVMADAFIRAAKMKATGGWYSGDLVAGMSALLTGKAVKPKRTMVNELTGDLATWVAEASALGEEPAKPLRKRARRPRRQRKAKSHDR